MATNTYVALRTETVAVATGTVTFDLTGISGYTDLVIVINGVGATGTTFPWMRFNGLSTNIYSDTQIAGNGSTPASSRRTAQSRGYIAEQVEMGTTQVANTTVHIMNYSNSTTNKTYLVRNNNAGSGAYVGTEAIVGMAQTTEAITSITIGTASGGTDYNFAVGSTFSLYGIKAWAGEVTPKATGGYVYEDSSYWYHAFPFSSTFTPNQSLTADCLVIAGGGGGGDSPSAGGGGAGGLLAYTSQSLTAQNYTITVGAGGGGGGGDGTQGTSGTNSQFASLTASAGGGGGGAYQGALSGGSGGGGGYFNGSNNGVGYPGASGTLGQGNTGGTGFAQTDNHSGGGGGGATAVGGNASNGGPAGNGGAGSSAYSSWGSVTSTGQNISGTYWFAGGGGGGHQNVDSTGDRGLGGNGGGGNGGVFGAASNAIVQTGGGGGGGGYGIGGNGGSGIVIVRYAK